MRARDRAETIDGLFPNRTENRMPFITAPDGTQIFYKDWGTGQPVVFSHGWPLTADAWDAQMHVRRRPRLPRDRPRPPRPRPLRASPGTATTWTPTPTTSPPLIEALDLQDAMLVGHSTGGGEVARYIGRHGTGRVAKAVLIGAVPPLMLKTDANPGGLPIEVFDGIRAGVAADRSQFYKDLRRAVLRLQPARRQVSQGVRDEFWLQGMTVGLAGRLRLHQGLLRDRLHRGPEEDRRPDADPPRRRRPDRADRRRRR